MALAVAVYKERRNWQLALYLVHLATGNTLWCRSLKFDTLQCYIRDIARFLHRFCAVDPRYATPTDRSFAPCLAAIFAELKRLDEVPSKQEPYTIQMQDALRDMAKGQDFLELIPALLDWFTKGLFGGCRLSEWAQRDSASKLGLQAVDVKGVALAFCIDDLDFRGVGNTRLDIHIILVHWADIAPKHMFPPIPNPLLGFVGI